MSEPTLLVLAAAAAARGYFSEDAAVCPGGARAHAGIIHLAFQSAPGSRPYPQPRAAVASKPLEHGGSPVDSNWTLKSTRAPNMAAEDPSRGRDRPRLARRPVSLQALALGRIWTGTRTVEARTGFRRWHGPGC